MNAKDILKIKGKTLYTAPLNEPINNIIETMAQFDIGSIIIVKKGKILGIVTFREILKHLAKQNNNISNYSAADLMTEITPGTPDLTVDNLSKIMLKHKTRYLPIVDNGILMGVLSFHDVTRAMFESKNFENELLRKYIS